MVKCTHGIGGRSLFSNGMVYTLQNKQTRDCFMRILLIGEWFQIANNLITETCGPWKICSNLFVIYPRSKYLVIRNLSHEKLCTNVIVIHWWRVQFTSILISTFPISAAHLQERPHWKLLLITSWLITDVYCWEDLLRLWEGLLDSWSLVCVSKQQALSIDWQLG